jgi:hypothetical protein
MEGDDFLSRFIDDEGADGARAALRFCAAHRTSSAETEFNVWLISLDVDSDELRFEHDFDPVKGTMPLSDFVRGLEAHLAREQP